MTESGHEGHDREHVMQTRKTLDVNRLENWALINVNLIVRLFMWSGH